MAYKKCIKNLDILTSDERTHYLKDKTIYRTAKDNSSNNIISKKSNNCLKSTDTYETRYNLLKGHNLVRTDCSNQYINLNLLGNINEANFIKAQFDATNSIINDTTRYKITADPNGSITGPTYSLSTINNNISPNDPETDQTGSRNKSLILSDMSNVMIDPNRIYIYKESCKPLIYLQDPSGNRYYDISLNSLDNSYNFYKILNNNNKLSNFSLNSSIKL